MSLNEHDIAVANSGISVSIVIPALNEGKNIGNLLKTIISQKLNNYIIAEIIVISDGSTDDTVLISRSVKDERIVVIDEKERLGKGPRLNQAFSIMKGDVLIVFDADIVLSDEQVIFHLISSFRDKAPLLVCGKHLPLKPDTYIEGLAYFGFYFWEEVKKVSGTHAQRYICNGLIRAFSFSFIEKFHLPPGVGPGEDAYSFYFAKKIQAGIISQENALVYFRLPTNFKDYVKQMSRFMNTPNILTKYYDKEFLERYDSVSLGYKIKALINLIKKTSPFTIVGYIILQLTTNIYSRYRKHEELWEITSSSKLINS